MLNVIRDVKGRKSFYKYISSKRKAGENVGPLLNGTQERPRYSMPSPSLSLMVRLAFRNPRSLRPVGESTAKTHLQWGRMRLGNIFLHLTS